MAQQISRVVALLRESVRPLGGSADDYAPLLDRARGVRLVLIGEASHGTHEFYAERARITQQLITEQGFNAVAIEGDWPDASRVHRFVQGRSPDRTSTEALGGFERFPTWMWRNEVVRDFVTWLRAHNDAVSSPERKVGFYGLDLYSLYTSISHVIRYLDKVDPEASRRARNRYSCFEQFTADPHGYGLATRQGLADPCEEQVVSQLVELRKKAPELAKSDGKLARDEYFFAEQNARLIKNAEAYYRAMYRGRVSSWNLRDHHMAETLDNLIEYLDAEGASSPAKVVVWAHNSHLGDARATQMGNEGELNLGQLVRERYRSKCLLVGFSTYAGTVTAADDWDEPMRRKHVRPGLSGSYEALLHEVGLARFLLMTRDDPDLRMLLNQPRIERAIGVIYRPQTERASHYLTAQICDQFDALIHIDQTRAVQPLDASERWHSGEAPETYPSGL